MCQSCGKCILYWTHWLSDSSTWQKVGELVNLVTCKTFVYLRVLHSKLFPQFGVRRNSFSLQRIWDIFIEQASLGHLTKVKDSEHWSIVFLLFQSLCRWFPCDTILCSFTEPTPEGIKRRPWSLRLLLLRFTVWRKKNNRQRTKTTKLSPKIPVDFPPLSQKCCGHPSFLQSCSLLGLFL